MSEILPHKSLAEALAAFQGEAPTLHKSETADTGKYKYKYVDLADLVETIRPHMLKHGLSFSSFPCTGADGQPALRYTLRHASGDTESEVMPLMLSQSNAQGQGSAISYARRYALTAVLNLVADADDDGAAASRRPEGAARLRGAASGLNGGQIREAFRSVGLVSPGGEVPPQHWFDSVPRDKVHILSEALEAIQR